MSRSSALRHWSVRSADARSRGRALHFLLASSPGKISSFFWLLTVLCMLLVTGSSLVSKVKVFFADMAKLSETSVNPFLDMPQHQASLTYGQGLSPGLLMASRMVVSTFCVFMRAVAALSIVVDLTKIDLERKLSRTWHKGRFVWRHASDWIALRVCLHQAVPSAISYMF
jgi:hypothetical protein